MEVLHLPFSPLNRDSLLDTQSRDRPRDHELLDLLGAFEDVEDPPRVSRW